MIKAVIFDLDGTLVNSLQDLCDSTNYALEKFGLNSRRAEEFNYLVGDGIPNLIKRAISPEKFSPQIHKKVYTEFLAHYRQHFLDKTLPYENIPLSLRRLKKMGLKLAIVSNKADDMARAVVESLFSDEFSVVAGKKENYPLKPDPALTLEVMNELGVKPSECVFIGDSGMDMATAVNAGCIGVGVLWGFRKKEELIENGADYLLKNPIEIVPSIAGIMANEK